MKARGAAQLLETQAATRTTEFDAEQTSDDLLNQSYEACLVELQL
jgi:hypothetical protein